MKLRQIPLPEPVYLMRCTVPAQRMSLSIQQRTMAGLSVAASRTAKPDVPAVVNTSSKGRGCRSLKADSVRAAISAQRKPAQHLISLPF